MDVDIRIQNRHRNGQHHPILVDIRDRVTVVKTMWGGELNLYIADIDRP